MTSATCYFDSSALVKRYLLETGTAWVQRWCDDPAQTIAVAEIGLVEIAAAFASKLRWACFRTPWLSEKRNFRRARKQSGRHSQPSGSPRLCFRSALARNFGHLHDEAQGVIHAFIRRKGLRHVWCKQHHVFAGPPLRRVIVYFRFCLIFAHVSFNATARLKTGLSQASYQALQVCMA